MYWYLGCCGYNTNCLGINSEQMKKTIQDPIIDLLTKKSYEDDGPFQGVEAKFNEWKKKYTTTDKNEALDLKIGDVVEFWAGFHGDIRYRTKILGFDVDGKAFMYWDCYWFPVDLLQREYKKVII